MEKDNQYALDTVADKNGALAFKDYDAIKRQLVISVANTIVPVIENKETRTNVLHKRADLNNAIKTIDRRRIDAVNDAKAIIEAQAKELNSILKAKIEEIDNAVKSYDESLLVAEVTRVEPTKPRTYVATIKFTDEKIIKKLTDLCEKNNIQLTIK